MPSKWTYMVRLKNGRVGRTNSLADAKKAVNKAGGGVVSRKTRAMAGDGAWDWPTWASTTSKVVYQR